MGYVFQKDGECYMCGAHSEFFCDHCLRYICDDHKKKKKLKAGKKTLTMCPDCYKKGKNVVKPYRRYANAAYSDLG